MRLHATNGCVQESVTEEKFRKVTERIRTSTFSCTWKSAASLSSSKPSRAYISTLRGDAALRNQWLCSGRAEALLSFERLPCLTGSSLAHPRLPQGRAPSPCILWSPTSARGNGETGADK